MPEHGLPLRWLPLRWLPLRWRRRGKGGETPALPPPALDRRQGAWLLGAAAVTLAPHTAWVPGWVAALCALLLGWRAMLLWRGSAPPPGALLLPLALAAVLAVRAEFGHFFGKDPGVAMLALLLGLKLLEIRAARDIRATVLLCFFLQLALFLESQSPLVAAQALAGSLLALVALVALADPRARWREQLRTGTTLLLQGLPFMLVLFLLFPRVQGPLWGLPADAFSARTGLSETMSPGSISRLGESGAIAFRAAFAGPPPPPAQRYWRGPVLTEFDGRSWRAAAFDEAATPFYTPDGARLDYRLTLEAHNRRWLLALDYPGSIQPPARYASDHHALAAQPVRARSRFELTAYPATPVGAQESTATLSAALRLPEGANPRSVALARTLAADAASHEVILQRVIGHLRDSRLIYTLRPPLLGRDTVDGFLFETRRGFCEHFASAFTVLMRAAGVPARVVTGYQGGELNPVDAHLVVRQADAHAWSEVWLAGRGWVRVDPTALAAPRRIEDGLAAALPAGELLPLMLRPQFDWLRDLRHRWEAVSNAWNQRVLGYNPERQRELLAQLGFHRADLWTIAGLLGGTCLLLFGALLLWAVHRRRPQDPLERAWRRLCHRLARLGCRRAPWEGPLAYGQRAAAALPRHADAVRELAAAYARQRYGHAPSAAERRALARKMNTLDLS